jgi:tetratricopeptide (TPR) repeat protein
MGFWMSNAYYAPPDFAVYFSYTHTLLSDRDLDFLNEYEHFGFEKHLFYVTGEGYISNDWPIGAGILWMPFFCLGSVVARLSGSPPDGFGIPYLSLVMVGILFFVGSGLYAGFIFLEKRYRTKWAFLTVLLCFFGTSLLFYACYGGWMSHATGFCIVTLFFILWAETISERKRIDWILLGFLAGLMTLTRPQHIASLIVFPIELFFRIKKSSFKTFPWKKETMGWLLLFLAFLIAFLPQLVFWGKIYGHPFSFPKLEEMHWFSPRIRETLFSDYHGILPWTPLVLLGSMGLLFVWKREKVLAAGLFVALALQIYINSANEVWWAGGSFGNRRITEYAFPVMVGLAGLFEEKRRRFWIIPAILFSAWSFLLVVAERAGALTLANYVPWNAQFFQTLIPIITAPWKWFGYVHGNFADLAGFYRMIAILFLGILFLVAGLLFEQRKIFVKRRMMIVSILFVFLALSNVLVLVSAKRTSPLKQELRENFYKENRFLWNNYYEYGFYLMQKRRYQEALEVYLKAKNLLPERPQPYRYIGSIYESFGDFDKAEQYYREALKLNPDYTRVKVLLEELQYKMRN